MSVYYEDDRVTLLHGDCLDVLRSLPDASVDAVCTDPPYNLSFMAKPWDAHGGQEDAGFAYWLAGLIDGEGHFAIKRHTRGTHAPYFTLKMRADEAGTLAMIRRKFGHGTIQQDSGTNPMLRWTLGDKAGCQALVDLLDKYPLRAKKMVDFWPWREAVIEWTSRPRGNRWHGAANDDRMAALRTRLMETRKFNEVAWSGNEFQDWCRLWATECLRVLKPGGHLLAFGGARTWHRLAGGIEDAGFEIRDSIAWLFGSGFPKSMDVSKAIDRSTGENHARQLEFTAWMRSTGITAAQINAATDSFMGSHYLTDRKQAAIATAEMFDRLRSLLPEIPERIERLVAERTGIEWTDYVNRPVVNERFRAATGRAEQGTGGYAFGEHFADTSAATDESARWQGWGTALKPAFEPIVVARKPLAGTVAATVLAHGTGAMNIDACRLGGDRAYRDKCASVVGLASNRNGDAYGEWSGAREDSAHALGRWPANAVLDESQATVLDEQNGSNEDDLLDGASRFFYVAKADSGERPRVGGVVHPTVKPLELMRWLVRLVTPPGGVVLEPFAGSGTTVEACLLEGFKCVAIEREADYLPLILQRINRRRDPVAAVKGAGEDGGLFDLLDDGGDAA